MKGRDRALEGSSAWEQGWAPAGIEQKPPKAAPRHPAVPVPGCQVPAPRRKAQENLSSHPGTLTRSPGHGLAKEILIYGSVPVLSMQSVQGTLPDGGKEGHVRANPVREVQHPRAGLLQQGSGKPGCFQAPFFQEKGGKGTSRHSSSIQILHCSLLGSRALPGLQRTSASIPPPLFF